MNEGPHQDGIIAISHRERGHGMRAAGDGLPIPGGHDDIGRGAARDLNRCSGLLALSVLLDSAVEHYRGNYHNKAMLAPLITSTLSLAASAHGVACGSPHKIRQGVFALALATGAAGTLFHVYNITKHPGGFSWQNLFYAAPLGAPSALTVCGLAGIFAERMHCAHDGDEPRLFGHGLARITALTSAIAIVGTTAEAALLHFRGAFQNPFMFFPVTLPPVAAALLARDGLAPPKTAYPVTRGWLTATAVMGLAGAGFHIYGVSRAMGGWRNWRQNMVDGPPIPAPPSYTALAFAGLAALRILARPASGEPPMAPASMSLAQPAPST